MKKIIGLLALLSVLYTLHVDAKEYSVISPDGNLSMRVWTEDTANDKGMLTYDISYKGKEVILPSVLGMNGWDNRFTIEDAKTSSVDETWKPVYGERSTIRDHYNQTIFVLGKEGYGSKLNLIVRAYDEGIAFRYYFPEHAGGGDYLGLDSEKTTFNVPADTYCWFMPYAQAKAQYLPIKDWPGEAERPLTMKLANGLYAALAEAEMVNFSRTKFKVNKGEENIIRCSMYDRVEDTAPFAMPWRVVMVAEKPTQLLANNDIILNLNEPCAIENTDWIKPGTIIRITSLTTDDAKKVVDFAAEHNIDYVHFDAGWYGAETKIASDPTKCNVDPARCPVNDLNVEEVVKYAKSKGVGVWVYVNQRALAKYLDEILPLYQSWGIAGIKFGFVHVGNHRWTTWLHEAVAKCAKYNLMVDIHDEYRPTGFSRTYPNLLTQEGVHGNEEFPDGNTNTTLPFTRFLCGPADCTVCYFHRKELKKSLPLNARSLLNTSGHQLATSVVFYSPLQFLYWYDKPEDAQGEPELEFFDQLPTVWDDTKILDGGIGEFITVARRSGNKWFVGCMTNNDARTIDFSFDFLDPAKKYEATLYTDGGEAVKTRTHVKIEKKKVSNESKMQLDLLPRGGCVMIINEI